ncbi:hypothetical protein AOZ06_49060 [Kibdelosporangium phytohabitans]|uniref:Uncharacterized protein n=2 Tax=Kibdelosporangium phytohabitans TaxID=860235 RepID=A0A0N9IBQ8_9PSEU|nr:hypothetical protein [Kibdelosporangium phytohabitans]ALG13766.1 hypothetical protein AOZ06_49060 [Kibdelosporangium phytohabitans]
MPDGVGVASGLTLTSVDRERVLPVCQALAGLFPWGGLRRGSTVAVRGSATVLLALLAEATAGGSWAGVIGMPRLGIVAASELGVAVSRLALVPKPGADLPAVAGALLDGMDIVVIAAAGRLQESHARRLSARARHRGAVLVPFGPWPGADLELAHVHSRWAGMSNGYGHFHTRELTIAAQGRGSAARPSTATVFVSRDGVTTEPVALPSDGFWPPAAESLPVMPSALENVTPLRA